MKKTIKKGTLFIALSIGVPAILFAIYFGYKRYMAPLPFFGENYAIVSEDTDYRVPDYEFINQDSLLITNNFTKGKVWVANYFYTSCPSICPKMMSGLYDVQEAFKGEEELRLVSFTVDPEYDTPHILKDYAEVRGIDTNQWQLVTGTKKDLYRFARTGLYIVATSGNGGTEDFIHSEKLVLIDQERHIRGYYDGTSKTDVAFLIDDIKRLLKN
ncbi:SCO family protein [Neptunitalea lumnitzerae]|uniref:Photosynthetic protein synthase II n=1 Tax=Neptunitalea lumnitzerae TaxID=2965509 RepID=A0ABQ5MM21_9FLAO|nr:SCO family protein [Neptunitalea sp. Y10]GLB50455.1 photosynthetic protein synthase II [Neptunitalea sp. Y10]